MSAFNKALDQLIHATLLKIAPSETHLGVFLNITRRYLPDNFIMAVSVSLKTFCSTRRKCAKYFALRLTLKASLGMNLTTRIQTNLFHSSSVIKNVF